MRSARWLRGLRAVWRVGTPVHLAVLGNDGLFLQDAPAVVADRDAVKATHFRCGMGAGVVAAVGFFSVSNIWRNIVQ